MGIGIASELGHILGAILGIALFCYGANSLVKKFFKLDDLNYRILITIMTLLIYCFVFIYVSFGRRESGVYILDSLIHYFMAAVVIHFFFALKFRKGQLLAAIFYAIVIFYLSLIILVPIIGRVIIVDGTVGNIFCLFAILFGGGLSGFLVMNQKLPFTKGKPMP